MAHDPMAALEEHSLKLVAVTGGGSGIGRALCHLLADSGLEVIALGRSIATLQETAAGRASITTRVLDARDMAKTQAVFDEIKETHGQPVDGLVAAAAIYPKVHFLDQSAESFDDTIVTNVLGVANVIRAVLPDMLARHMGRISVIGSLADQNPIPDAAAYSASKGALHALVRGIASEIDQTRYPNVLINEMLPPPTQTAMSDFGATPEEVARFAKAQLDFSRGGPHGTAWAGTKQIHFGDGLATMILRKLKLK